MSYLERFFQNHKRRCRNRYDQVFAVLCLGAIERDSPYKYISIYAGLAALMAIAVLYILSEAGSEWIGGKDDVAHPLYKRVFHLFLLLLFGGLILVILWFVLKNLGLIAV
jgi:hypothetical protein